MTKHRNLSIFVPHRGCPHRCSYCDQRRISGTRRPPDPRQVAQMCQKFLPTDPKEAEQREIAFFGGSFTAIERGYMLRLLDAAYPFVKEGRAAGIRISTRPDAIDSERLYILRLHGVTSIELGAQSMDDRVLKKNLRGHTVKDVYIRSEMIKDRGFSLGLQMMTGLYGREDYTADAIRTAGEFLKIHPDTVRIYPTLTLENTLLRDLYRRGEYNPPSLEESVELCALLLPVFENAGIKVIKLGLHADRGLEKSLVAGPYHPAFRELVLGRLWLDRFASALSERGKGVYDIYVPARKLSQALGQHRQNEKALADMGYIVGIKADPELQGREFRAEKIGGFDIVI